MKVPSTDGERAEALIQRYDAEAKSYLSYWAPVIHPASCRLVGELVLPSAHRVLDLGAGAGTLLPVLGEKFGGAVVVGVDRSEGMLSLADTDDSVAVMDALDLGFRAAVFDLVVMSFMLFHLPDAAAGLKEARRILRPGGKLSLSTWATDIEAPAVRSWNDALDAHGAPAADALPRLANHDIMDTPDKVENLLGSAGFVSVEATVHEFSHTMQPDDFVALRLHVGATSQRLRSLTVEAQQHCVTDARSRLAALSPEDFTLRMKIILTSATTT